ncbi:MAG: flagellar protein FlaG [Acidobacteriota bacterium]
MFSELASVVQITSVNKTLSENRLPVRGESPAQTQSQPQTQPPAENRSQAPEEIEQALGTLNQVIEPVGISLKFTQDEASKTMVIELIDQSNGQILRQIPSEAMLRLSASLSKLKGLVVDQRI